MMATNPLPYRHQMMLELFTAAVCPAGSRTFVDLSPGLAAVLERLEYGAGKHPQDDWGDVPAKGHIAALRRHAFALAVSMDMYPAGEKHDRQHLAAIACRALMALTVDSRDDA
jgi:hypothetical protein